MRVRAKTTERTLSQQRKRGTEAMAISNTIAFRVTVRVRGRGKAWGRVRLG